MAYWRMGFYIGVGGSITYPRANKTRTMVQAMPLEALLLETDAPDMPLHGFQGRDNSPAQLLRIATTLAELRGDTLENIAQHTTQNSRHLFSPARQCNGIIAYCDSCIIYWPISNNRPQSRRRVLWCAVP